MDHQTCETWIARFSPVIAQHTTNNKTCAKFLRATLGPALAAFALMALPSIGFAEVKLVWTCPSATIGSADGSCPNNGWSWQRGEIGQIVASATAQVGYGEGTWRRWENVPQNEYVFTCTADIPIGQTDGCPTPGVYTHELYLLKSSFLPSAPTNLAATPVSSTQINLSWTASTDDVGVTGYLVERCQGASCTNFSQIATPTGTTYNDTGRSPSTTYRYRVRARDVVPNYSSYSSIVNATTPAGGDTQPPTAPTGLTATPVSSTQINLSWTASTDNVGVTGYLVERCQGASCTSFSQIATPTGTTYNDTGRSPSTTYRYRVRARDAVPNFSNYSSIVNATTPATADTQPPTAPTGLTVTAGANQNVLAWTASTDNVGVTAYLVERCSGAGCSSFAQIGAPSATSYTDATAVAGISYRYRVRARDAVPNYSGYSNIGSATPADCD